MHYQEERNTGCRISDAWTYRGLKTVVLENESIRVTVLADKGADVYSFVHKPTDVDFMWRTPWGVRDPRKFLPTTGAPTSIWLDVYEGGWQTVVPHGGFPSTVAGAELGLHGEVNTMPWDVDVVEDSSKRVSARFRVKGARTPFRVEKTLTVEAGSTALVVEESVTNEGEEPADCVWLEHIAIGAPLLASGARLNVPACTILNHPADMGKDAKLKPGWSGPSPKAAAKRGAAIDFSRFPGKEDRSLDMAYFTGMKEGWYAVTNDQLGVGFGVSFPVSVFEYLWFWRNLGGGTGYPWYRRCYNVGLEPCTSFPNTGLGPAIENKTARRFRAGQTVSATIHAVAYTGKGKVRRITSGGGVERG
jgi:hypothetical protein